MRNHFSSEKGRATEIPSFFFEQATHTLTTTEVQMLADKAAQILEQIEKIRAEYDIPEGRKVAVPCNLSHEPNEVTTRTFEREADDSRLPRFSNTDDLFEDLGI